MHIFIIGWVVLFTGMVVAFQRNRGITEPDRRCNLARNTQIGSGIMKKIEEELVTAPALAPRKVMVAKGAHPVPVRQATIKKAIVDENVAATDTEEKKTIRPPEQPRLAAVSVALEEPTQVQPPLMKRPRFEESHRRRTIYLENKLDYKVQAICASHSIHRSMTGLIHAALMEYIQTHQL